jgi:uncharacterized cupredoxin-like copper-binding protein
MQHFCLPALLVGALLACIPAGAAAAQGDSTHAHAHKPAKKTRASPDKPYGRPGDPRKVKRVIALDMSDAMRFFPDSVSVKRGSTVRFQLRNSGQLPHEMVIGTMDELKKHALLMKHNPHHDHDDAHAVHVQPGATARLVWQFTKPGEFHYACLVPGHFEAGMIGTIVVR